MKHVALVGLFFAFAVTVVAAAEKPQVTISASGRFFPVSFVSRAANVRLIVRMEKHERNWTLDVSCEGLGGGVFTSSGKSFYNGERQAEIYDLSFNLPSATYRCEVTLHRKLESGEMKNFTSSLEVMVY
ncbi:MAG: hypothetical protein HYX22_02005 [Candidatus Yanofskybacteria bacterium]|nr:hypothetical protein [Candidatus Yanofskybacteria bacterium]